MLMAGICSSGFSNWAIFTIQFFQSRFSISKAIGEPMVFPKRIPDSTTALSVSIFMRPPLPYPCWRRASSLLISSGVIVIPEGSPSTIAESAGPCDSPAVKYLIIVFYPVVPQAQTCYGSLKQKKPAACLQPGCRDTMSVSRQIRAAFLRLLLRNR